MSILVFVALAFAPGIFWLWFYYRQDRYEPEPKMWIVKVFVLGMLVVIPAAIAEALVGKIFPFLEGKGLISILLYSFLVIAPIEEYAKYLAVKKSVYKTLEFDEITDGIIYSATAALGFASLENLFYMIDLGASVMIVRAPLSTLGHVLFSGMWGYYLGLAKFSPGQEKRLIKKGLLLAILFHGAYDFILFTNTVLALLVIPLMFIMYRKLASMIRISAKQSPYREEDTEAET